VTQHLRRSQFVTTWGPGAILEGQEGPRLILRADIGLFHPRSGLKPEDYEIHNRQVASVLPEGSRVFRLPSNAELGKSPNTPLYMTSPFPGWSQCPDHDILYRSDAGCPQCQPGDSTNARASRFVVACLSGHLDDVDWDSVVKHASGCHPGSWYKWRGEGGPLSQIEIVCPACNGSANLGRAYSLNWPCLGRFPERETTPTYRTRGHCASGVARIMQRQASHLRIPEVRSVFTITPAYTKLHNLLQIREFQVALSVLPPSSMKDLRSLLDKLVAAGHLADSSRNEISLHEWPEIQRALAEIGPPTVKGLDEASGEELRALTDASAHGVPPITEPPPLSRVLFEVKHSAIKRPITGPGGHSFRVVPVSRLNVVLVQSGYRRQPVPDSDPGPKSTLVDCSFPNPSGHWFPGAELMGEGLFIMPDNDGGELFLKDAAGRDWRTAYPAGTTKQAPLFVWWHTLSHLLLRALSVDSGYSAAAIRERVYVAGEAHSGVILYSVQPGADGTLGGLVSLAGSFDRILGRVTELAETCSNDPLCSEMKVSPGGHSGAACYACLLASETSCEDRNMWLDRHVFLADPP
jgi:hypothetical protein